MKANFNKHAHSYDQNAHVQKLIADQLVNFIKPQTPPLSILELGCGTGYLTQKLEQNFTQAKILACDPAPEMLRIAQSKSSAQFQNCFTPQEGLFDLITSSMAIQWVDDWTTWFESLSQRLNKKAEIYLASPIIGSLDLLQKSYQMSDLEFSGLTYRSSQELQKSAALNGIQGEFQELNFEDIFDSSLDFFKQLHAIGANVQNSKLSRSQLRQVIKNCESFKRGGKLRVNYKICFFKGIYV